MSQDTTEPSEDLTSLPGAKERKPRVSLWWQIVLYAHLPVSTFMFVFAIIDSGSALIGWFRDSKITMSVHLSETTGTVSIQGERNVTGLIKKLDVEVEGFTDGQVAQFVGYHIGQAIAATAIIMLGFMLMRRFLRREIFSETNTAIVSWLCLSGLIYALMIELLGRLSDKAVPLVFGSETEMYNSSDAIIPWFTILVALAIITAFERGQELQKKLSGQEEENVTNPR